jgi:hypothetical protein
MVVFGPVSAWRIATSPAAAFITVFGNSDGGTFHGFDPVIVMPAKSSVERMLPTVVATVTPVPSGTDDTLARQSRATSNASAPSRSSVLDPLRPSSALTSKWGTAISSDGP